MGREAKIGLVARTSEEAKERVLRAVAEDQMGPVLKRNFYRECPKCGAGDKSIRKQYCPGTDSRLVELGQNSCAIQGEHMHGKCVIEIGGCGHFWREECADVDENPKAAKRASSPSR